MERERAIKEELVSPTRRQEGTTCYKWTDANKFDLTICQSYTKGKLEDWATVAEMEFL